MLSSQNAASAREHDVVASHALFLNVYPLLTVEISKIPSNSLRVGDPIFIGTHTTATIRLLGIIRLLRGAQAPFYHLRFLIIFGLYVDFFGLGKYTAIRNHKVDAWIIQYPFRAALLPYCGFATK